MARGAFTFPARQGIAVLASHASRLKSLLAVAGIAVVAVGCGSTTVIQGAGTQTSGQTVTQTVVQPQPSGSASQAPPAVNGLRSCGGNVSANQHTSCPFAEAVYRKVAIESGSAQGMYSVYSSVTGRYYSMSCAFEQTRIVCRGGNDAVVSWPG
jgi:hypothetical protein